MTSIRVPTSVQRAVIDWWPVTLLAVGVMSLWIVEKAWREWRARR